MYVAHVLTAKDEAYTVTVYTLSAIVSSLRVAYKTKNITLGTESLSSHAHHMNAGEMINQIISKGYSAMKMILSKLSERTSQTPMSQ